MTGPDLHSRRLRLGLSRDQLAHRLGVTAEALASWEDEVTSIGFPAATELVLRDAERTEEPRHSPAERR